ncbi:MAG: arginase family protein, partial [Bdellovibrionales bacterium]|nr:arginase family protein [Bdellovibrionales bacterium]
MKETRIYSLIGYASGISGRVPGANDAPDALRNLGLISRLEAVGAEIRDLGNVSSVLSDDERQAIERQASAEERAAKNFADVFISCKRLYEKTSEALADETIPIILGGAHSCSIGSVSAVADHYAARGESIGLVWVDTHADLHTPQSSQSKNMHGMPISFLLGRVKGAMQQLSQHFPVLRPEHIAYIGLRDVDAAERETLQSLPIQAYTMKEIDRYGV